MREYPQLTIRLPPEVKARLQALGVVTGRAQWRLVADAVDSYFHTLSPADQQLVKGISDRLLKHG